MFEVVFVQRGMYMRNIVDIILNRSDICSNADIPELYDIASQYNLDKWGDMNDKQKSI